MTKRAKGKKEKRKTINGLNKIILPWEKVGVKGMMQFYNHWWEENACTSDKSFFRFDYKWYLRRQQFWKGNGLLDEYAWLRINENARVSDAIEKASNNKNNDTKEIKN